MWSWISNLFKPASDAYAAHQQLQAKKAELQSQLEVTKLQSDIAAEEAWREWRVKNIDADSAWELEQIKNSGWKDEYILVLLSIPLILVFIPWTAPYVLTGFNVLMQCPDWYRWLILSIFTAVYGIRIWRRPTE